MRFQWINKQNNKKLILFMNGWGMDNEIISSPDPTGYDVLGVFDYREINDFREFDFDCYSEKTLLAWSMGVYCANLFCEFFNDFDKKIALAGTNKIIDNDFGIPLKIYNYTVKFFDDESAKKFLDSMFSDKRNIKLNRTAKELKDELIAIQKLKITSEIKYDKAIIPKKDTIVPYKNQMKYWENQGAQIIEINSPHFVFDNYKSYGEIVC